VSILLGLGNRYSDLHGNGDKSRGNWELELADGNVRRRLSWCVVAAHDYCQWDTFEASCPRRDELVVMKTAVYGRMASRGHCIERDYGYVGCQSDVLLKADLRCSGRRQCKLDIPYQPFGVGHPCPRDLTLFLRASFICVKGKICPCF